MRCRCRRALGVYPLPLLTARALRPARRAAVRAGAARPRARGAGGVAVPRRRRSARGRPTLAVLAAMAALVALIAGAGDRHRARAGLRRGVRRRGGGAAAGADRGRRGRAAAGGAAAAAAPAAAAARARQPPPARRADRPAGGRARARPHPVRHAGGDRDQPCPARSRAACRRARRASSCSTSRTTRSAASARWCARRRPAREIRTVPSLRGPIVAFAGKRVADMKTIPEGAWILRGDRGAHLCGDLARGQPRRRRAMVAGRLCRAAARLDRRDARRRRWGSRSATRSPSRCSASR